MQLAANSQCSAFVGFPRAPKKSESASICKTCVNALLVSVVEATQHSRKEYVSNATRSQLSMLCFCYQWKQRNTPPNNVSNAAGSQQSLSICSPCLNALLMLGFREPRESLRARRSAPQKNTSPMQLAANRLCRSAVLASMPCLCWVSESPAKV